jgi:uncharacterized membrane protein
MTEPSLNLPALTVAYRRLVLWYGAQLVISIDASLLPKSLSMSRLWAPLTVSSNVTLPTGSPAALVLFFILSVGSLASIVGLIMYAYRTAQALGLSSPASWAFAMLVPALNFITLLVLSSKAGKVCRDHGIPVGLLGPKPGPIT